MCKELSPNPDSLELGLTSLGGYTVGTWTEQVVFCTVLTITQDKTLHLTWPVALPAAGR